MPLAMQATCKGNSSCYFDWRDLVVEIRMTNTGTSPVMFPLEYRQQTGPTIRLMDPKSKTVSYVKTNVVDRELRKKLIKILPGKSVTLEWAIKPTDMQPFAKSSGSEIEAEITIQADLQIDEKHVPFIGTHTLRIINK